MDDVYGGISGRSREQLARLTARGRHIVTVDDAVDRLDLDRDAAAKLLARWADQGWLRRVRRGLYVAVPVDVERPDLWTADPFVIATAVWSPCYITGWTAGNHWGLTDQLFRSVVVRTSKRVRSTEQTLLDQDYLVGSVAEDKLEWGIRKVWKEHTPVQFADEARVIIDVLDDPSIGGGIRHCADMLTTYLHDHEPDRLLDYADRLGNAAVLKRLGYLSEALNLTDEGFLAQCQRRLSAGTSMLDPSAHGDGERNARWHLRTNVRLEPSAAS